LKILILIKDYNNILVLILKQNKLTDKILDSFWVNIKYIASIDLRDNSFTS
jgi:hypothetical protein